MQNTPVVHFEMPSTDSARVIKFYETVFNWKMNTLGPEMGNYILATTAETDEKGMNKTPGTINGGFYSQTDPADPTQGTHVVISVNDLDKYIQLVKDAGGEIIDEPMDIPGIGRYVSIRDSEGNVVGMMQPLEMS